MMQLIGKQFLMRKGSKQGKIKEITSPIKRENKKRVL